MKKKNKSSGCALFFSEQKICGSILSKIIK